MIQLKILLNFLILWCKMLFKWLLFIEGSVGSYSITNNIIVYENNVMPQSKDYFRQKGTVLNN